MYSCETDYMNKRDENIKNDEPEPWKSRDTTLPNFTKISLDHSTWREATQNTEK